MNSRGAAHRARVWPCTSQINKYVNAFGKYRICIIVYIVYSTAQSHRFCVNCVNFLQSVEFTRTNVHVPHQARTHSVA